MMKRAVSVAGLSLCASAMTFSADAGATAAVCSPAAIEGLLVEQGREDGFADGAGVTLVRCGDLDADGDRDALFALGGGGTAGNTKWGIMLGRADGAPKTIAVYRSGDRVGVAIRRGRAEVLQPVHRDGDTSSRPSFFSIEVWQWKATRFAKVDRRRVERAPRRFYRR